MPARVVLLREGLTPREIPLERGVLSIGRAPQNDLVLGDETLSWRHAELWTRGRSLYVRDRGSTNGTFLNETRVNVPVAVVDGDRIRLGDTVVLRVEGAEPPGAPISTWLIEEVASGVRMSVGDSPWAAGSEGGEGVFVDADGGANVVSAGVSRRLADGDPFELRGVPLRVVRAPLLPVPTAGGGSSRYPYRLIVRLDGPSGPEAAFDHAGRPQSLVISAENRAVLLYVLARKVVEDRHRLPGAASAGWCSDEEVAIGIWGREGINVSPNNLHVLIHRVRRDLEAAGFDAGFLEKRRGATRLTLADVQLG